MPMNSPIETESMTYLEKRYSVIEPTGRPRDLSPTRPPHMSIPMPSKARPASRSPRNAKDAEKAQMDADLRDTVQAMRQANKVRRKKEREEKENK